MYSIQCFLNRLLGYRTSAWFIRCTYIVRCTSMIAMVSGVWCLVSGAWCMVHGVRCVVQYVYGAAGGVQCLLCL